jgi:hypothetical protein
MGWKLYKNSIHKESQITKLLMFRTKFILLKEKSLRDNLIM